jgi:hypothetical protein
LIWSSKCMGSECIAARGARLTGKTAANATEKIYAMGGILDASKREYVQA